MKNFFTKIAKAKKTIATFALACVCALGVTTICGTTMAPVAEVYAVTSGGGSGSTSTGTISDIGDKLGTTNLDTKGNILGNIVDLIGMLAKVVGALLGVYGLYKLIVAFKDQDANGITQGVVLLAVGIILIMFDTIVGAIFNI